MTKADWERHEPRSSARVARVFSPSNIALAKYWGKRDVELNLPTNGSISITLKDYGSFTTAEFDKSFAEDTVILNGEELPVARAERVIRVLDELRRIAGRTTRARIQSANNVPTAAGLASSASGLSAAAAAGAAALGLDLPKSVLSEIARKGSGSACRSLFGGFVEWKRGELADGTDSVAREIAPAEHWPLRVFVAVVNAGPKTHASTGGMERTRATSPYFAPWVESAQKQIPEIRAAIAGRDFARLSELSESNCIRMHASAMAAFPPVLYWQAATLEVMHRVWGLRRDGVAAFFTIDAGPNVVVVSEPGSASEVAAVLGRISGVRLLETDIGAGTRPIGGSA